jgi:hypothetical protein
MIPRCTATQPHYHVEDSPAAPHIARTWTGGIGDADMHCSAGAESYFVLHTSYYVLTLGTSPASTDPADF